MGFVLEWKQKAVKMFSNVVVLLTEPNLPLSSRVLSPKNRLNIRFERDRMSAQGVTHRSPLFTLIVSPNNLSTPRFAILISKKNVRLATRRNRLKRQISHILRTNLSTIPSDCDYLIIPKSICMDQDNQNLSTNLIKLFNTLDANDS